MLIRILTGIVGIALWAYIIQTGGWLFSAVALLLSLIGWHEYSRAFVNKGISTAYLSGMLGLAVLWYCGRTASGEILMAAATGIVLAILLLTVLLHGTVHVRDACVSIAGVFYLGLPFLYLARLRFLEGTPIPTPLGEMGTGCALVWVMFIGTWASDSFAYFVGSAIGRHKLCPSISPKKTVEGFLGSIVGTMASVAAAGHLFFGLPLLQMVLLGLLVSIFATLGDLVESVLKRYVGIKDSGALFPGHGGVLDRFDSVLYTAPLVYFFMVYGAPHLPSLMGR